MTSAASSDSTSTSTNASTTVAHVRREDGSGSGDVLDLGERCLEILRDFRRKSREVWRELGRQPRRSIQWASLVSSDCVRGFECFQAVGLPLYDSVGVSVRSVSAHEVIASLTFTPNDSSAGSSRRGRQGRERGRIEAVRGSPNRIATARPARGAGILDSRGRDRPAGFVGPGTTARGDAKSRPGASQSGGNGRNAGRDFRRWRAVDRWGPCPVVLGSAIPSRPGTPCRSFRTRPRGEAEGGFGA